MEKTKKVAELYFEVKKQVIAFYGGEVDIKYELDPEKPHYFSITEVGYSTKHETKFRAFNTYAVLANGDFISVYNSMRYKDKEHLNDYYTDFQKLGEYRGKTLTLRFMPEKYREYKDVIKVANVKLISFNYADYTNDYEKIMLSELQS
jgi:hypothetical protein